MIVDLQKMHFGITGIHTCCGCDAELSNPGCGGNFLAYLKSANAEADAVVPRLQQPTRTALNIPTRAGAGVAGVREVLGEAERAGESMAHL